MNGTEGDDDFDAACAEFGADGATSVSVPGTFLVGQCSRAGAALCKLGVTYMRLGIALAMDSDGPRFVVMRDEALEKTGEAIHVLNGTYRALRRVKVESKGTP